MAYELKCSPAEIRNSASELKTTENIYKEVVETLKTTKTEIQNNWEGDTTDINDIITRIDSVCSCFETTMIPGLAKMYDGLNTFATENEQIANNTVDNQSGTAAQNTTPPGGNTPVSGTPAKNVPKILTKGFWVNIGSEFTDDWDFSDTEGLLSGLGDLAEGSINFIGSVADAGANIVSGLLDIILA